MTESDWNRKHMRRAIEEVAWAIAEAEGRKMVFDHTDDWYNTAGHQNEREECRKAAQAAIEAYENVVGP